MSTPITTLYSEIPKNTTKKLKLKLKNSINKVFLSAKRIISRTKKYSVFKEENKQNKITKSSVYLKTNISTDQSCLKEHISDDELLPIPVFANTFRRKNIKSTKNIQSLELENLPKNRLQKLQSLIA